MIDTERDPNELGAPNSDGLRYCRECTRVRVPENILTDEGLKALRRERQEIIRKKHIGEGITEEEQNHLDQLTKKLRLHWRATAGPPQSYKYPPHWEECDFCDAKMKSEEEYRSHWDLCPIRKLDNDIAERAMGWKLDEDELGNRYWCGSWLNYDRRGFSEHQGGDSFEPSTNMSHTLWVMRTLEDHDWRFNISSGKGHRIVDVFVPGAGRSWSVRSNDMKLPEMICRAIMKAINGE